MAIPQSHGADDVAEALAELYDKMPDEDTIRAWIAESVQPAQAVADMVGHTLVDRGDPAAVDFGLADFIVDAAWHDLDLSSIVPAGADWVLLRVNALLALDATIRFRKNGNVNDTSAVTLRTYGDKRVIDGDCFVALDANRVIEYSVSAVYNELTVTVGGWMI